ncbi:MAG: TIGR00730 family Rossman fold protein [Akkermansiaceae bacterium]|nr:TIGR00730 family Rossman fold protein [Akkermansiaceae bacterium]
MNQPEYLAARDLDSRAGKRGPMSRAIHTGNEDLDARLDSVAKKFCGKHNPATLRQLLATALQAAGSSIEEHDLEMMNRTLAEMLAADKMFLPFRNVRKITCFGSARIKENEPAYSQAKKFAQLAARQGYMIITGGGPGIMQACNEGATEHLSFGLNITLPYEQHANHVVDGSDKMMNFYYFYTRKLNFLKQTDALVAFPGGFGTMDEIYECITLMQTGKSTLFPVVLLDPPGETFWGRWVHFIRKELLEAGLISPEDMSLLYVSKSSEDALAYIERFYRVFHSYYFHGEEITIRLMQPLDEKNLAWIRESFADLMPQGDLVQQEQGAEDPEPLLANLPRLHFTLKRGNYARLKELIDAINDD